MTNSLINKVVSVCRPSMLIAGVGLVFIFGLSSCFKEKPIKQPYINNTGDIHIANLGVNYTQQVYYNMQTLVFTDSNSKYDFNMSFDCDPASYNVWLNGSNLMFACHTGKYAFNDASFADTVSHPWREELGSGVPADNAIGVWGNYPLSNKEIYLINLGEDSNGLSLGYKKMQMGDCVGDSYIVNFCNMDGSDMHSVSVPRKANKNKVFLSFSDQKVHDFEPNQDNWDLFFTQYSVYFPVEHLPYKVTGVLTNPYRTVAYYQDSTSNYDSIKLSNVQLSKFTTTQDNIGYDWKVYSFGEYSVNNDHPHIYIVRSGGNHYYKMKFITFNNIQHQKGYPQFQYDELQ